VLVNASPPNERAAAIRAIEELQKLRHSIQREESLLQKVRAGGVSLKDGGQKLETRLKSQQQQLERMTNTLQGRVFSFSDAEGQNHGPFTSQQLQSLATAGLCTTLGVKVHRDGDPCVLTLQQAIECPEPATSLLLKQLQEKHFEEQAEKQKQLKNKQQAQFSEAKLEAGRRESKEVHRARVPGWKPREKRQHEQSVPASAWEVAAQTEEALNAEEVCLFF